MGHMLYYLLEGVDQGPEKEYEQGIATSPDPLETGFVDLPVVLYIFMQRP